MEWLIPEYIEALCAEAGFISRNVSNALRIGTIYLGGGTPSLIDTGYVDQIIDRLTSSFYVEPNAEITVEVNPGTISLDYLQGIYKSGVNRLSIGVQSSNPFDLHFLERIHNYIDVIHAVEWARLAGFENISLDLIYGIPGQSLQRWQVSLELAMGLHPDHLSIYALTVEDRTPLGRWTKHGLIEEADPDIAAEMYEWASESLSHQHYHQYEISNWARANAQGMILASRHNLQYWKNHPYIGLGAGAHGYINNCRVVNHRSPKEYVKRLRNQKKADPLEMDQDNKHDFRLSPACIEILKIDKNTEMSETMIMGLRLVNQGIDKEHFQSRFGISLEDAYGIEINKLVNVGLLEWIDNGRRIHLTTKGRLLGNQVFMEFV